jgi:hypothetical protein
MIVVDGYVTLDVDQRDGLGTRWLARGARQFDNPQKMERTSTPHLEVVANWSLIAKCSPGAHKPHTT